MASPDRFVIRFSYRHQELAAAATAARREMQVNVGPDLLVTALAVVTQVNAVAITAPTAKIVVNETFGHLTGPDPSGESDSVFEANVVLEFTGTPWQGDPEPVAKGVAAFLALVLRADSQPTVTPV